MWLYDAAEGQASEAAVQRRIAALKRDIRSALDAQMRELDARRQAEVKEKLDEYEAQA